MQSTAKKEFDSAKSNLITEYELLNQKHVRLTHELDQAQTYIKDLELKCHDYDQLQSKVVILKNEIESLAKNIKDQYRVIDTLKQEKNHLISTQ